MYIYCYNNINNKEYIKCYTLNGVKVTKLSTNKKINNFFIEEKIIIVYENNCIELFNLYDLSKNNIEVHPDIKDKNIITKKK